jgi:hypothetical protein
MQFGQRQCVHLRCETIFLYSNNDVRTNPVLYATSPVFVTFMGSFDIVAVGAFLISIFTLFFNMRQWSKKRRSERIVTAREIMNRVLSKQLLLETFR